MCPSTQVSCPVRPPPPSPYNLSNALPRSSILLFASYPYHSGAYKMVKNNKKVIYISMYIHEKYTTKSITDTTVLYNAVVVCLYTMFNNRV